MVVLSLPGVSRRLTAALIFSIVIGGTLPAVSMVAAGALVNGIRDAMLNGPSTTFSRQVIWPLVIIGVVMVAGDAIGRVTGVLATELGSRLDVQMQQRVITAVNGPASVSHLDDPRIQDLISAATSVGANRYRPADAVQGLSIRSNTWLQGLVAAALFATYHWWLALVVFGAHVWRGRVSRQDYLHITEIATAQTKRVRRSAYFRDLALVGGAIKELHVFGLADWLIGRFRSEWKIAIERSGHYQGRRGWSIAGSLAAVTAANALAYALLGWDAAHGALALGALVVYLRAAQGISSIVRLGSEEFQIEYGSQAVPAVLELEAAAAPALALAGTTSSPTLPERRIVLDNLVFSYPSSAQPVLRGLDLVIETGRSLAIVGPNGAGKTTLIKLLCRLYDPEAGMIRVDDTDLLDIDAKWWQRRIAAVFQDFTKYELSARDNVSFGAVELAGDLDAIESAAEVAGIRDHIRSLPKGWDTPLAPHLTGGASLSGGEWQRMALSRALIAVRGGARVLIMDEPTANLDVRAEAAFYDQFLDLTRGLTTILISHRFATVRHADSICVVDEGRVVEQGSHDELVERGGRYARMFALQSSRYSHQRAE